MPRPSELLKAKLRNNIFFKRDETFATGVMVRMFAAKC